MKYFIHILLFSLILAACTGSKKYFKAAEKLEKMGLVNEAAEFYMESLQRKTTNVDARIKLKEVGQKYVSFMSSEFFRSYNTGRYEESIEDYEKMKSFTDKAERLNVKLNYPPNYEEDYKKAVDKYCEKNYLLGENLVKEKKYNEALTYLKLVNNYQPEYRKVRDLTITASCEPSYKNAISAMENKSYSQAITHLNNIHKVTPDYKDTKELSEICNALLAKSLLMFQPKTTQNKQLVEELFNSFSQTLMNEHKNIELINNSPFVNLPGNNIEGNVDLIQGIRKATGSDYFFVYDIVNKVSTPYGPSKTKATCFRKYTYKKNDTLFITEYQPTLYYQVKAGRNYSYTFSYKLVNATTNQIVSFQNLSVGKKDEVEYNEFQSKPVANIDSYYPYNPQSTAKIHQFNPRSWRALFTANKNVKTEAELEDIVNKETVQQFSKIINNYAK